MGVLGLLLLSFGIFGIACGSECVSETSRCSQHWVKIEPDRNLMSYEELNEWCRTQGRFYSCLEDVLLVGRNGNLSYLPTNLLISKMVAFDLCQNESTSRSRYLNNSACINRQNIDICKQREYIDIVTPDTERPLSTCSLYQKTFSCVAASMIINCGFEAGKVYRNLLKITRYSDEVCDVEKSFGIPVCRERASRNSERDETFTDIYYGLVHRIGSIPEQETEHADSLSNEVQDPEGAEEDENMTEFHTELNFIDEDTAREIRNIVKEHREGTESRIGNLSIQEISDTVSQIADDKPVPTVATSEEYDVVEDSVPTESRAAGNVPDQEETAQFYRTCLSDEEAIEAEKQRISNVLLESLVKIASPKKQREMIKTLEKFRSAQSTVQPTECDISSDERDASQETEKDESLELEESPLSEDNVIGNDVQNELDPHRIGSAPEHTQDDSVVSYENFPPLTAGREKSINLMLKTLLELLDEKAEELGIAKDESMEPEGSPLSKKYNVMGNGVQSEFEPHRIGSAPEQTQDDSGFSYEDGRPLTAGREKSINLMLKTLLDLLDEKAEELGIAKESSRIGRLSVETDADGTIALDKLVPEESLDVLSQIKVNRGSEEMEANRIDTIPHQDGDIEAIQADESADHEAITEAIMTALDALDQNAESEQLDVIENRGPGEFDFDTKLDRIYKYPIITQIYRDILFYNYSGLEYAIYWRQPSFTIFENISCAHLHPNVLGGLIFRCGAEYRTRDPDCVSKATVHEPLTPELIRDIDPEVPDDSIVEFGPRPDWMQDMDDAYEAKRMREMRSTTQPPKDPSKSPTLATACCTLLHFSEIIAKPSEPEWWEMKHTTILPNDIKEELLDLLLPEPDEYEAPPFSTFVIGKSLQMFVYHPVTNAIQNMICGRVDECHPRGKGVFKCKMVASVEEPLETSDSTPQPAPEEELVTLVYGKASKKTEESVYEVTDDDEPKYGSYFLPEFIYAIQGMDLLHKEKIAALYKTSLEDHESDDFVVLKKIPLAELQQFQTVKTSDENDTNGS